MTQVETSYGVVRGAVSRGVHAFKGLPFATAGRFEPPRRPEPWTGVRDATAYGPICPQGVPGQPRQGLFAAMSVEPEPQSEDCFWLNVWTPGTDGKRPVLVYVHGGAFTSGSGSSPMYRGARLAARNDVVVVTTNYRLGVLGFLHAPGIGSVNLGLQDQVAALEWVRENIAAFGGDPSNVTVFGESAGGKSVECLLAMPSSRGLYERAIAQSTYGPPMDPAQAESRTAKLADEAGGLEALRTMPVDDLLRLNGRLLADAMRNGRRGAAPPGIGGGGPVVDGDVIPEHPVGSTHPVPLVVGTTLDESRLFGALVQRTREVDEDGLARRLEGTGIDPAKAIEVYRSTRGASSTIDDVWYAIQTDVTFRQHSIRLASAHAARQAQTYMYLFTWPAQGMEGRLGSPHGLDVPFVFGALGGALLGQLAGDSPEAHELSARMQDAWVAFARGEDPWPRYDTTVRRTQVFGERCEVQDAPLEAERLLWSTAS